jgi:NAD+ diphosphatase
VPTTQREIWLLVGEDGLVLPPRRSAVGWAPNRLRAAPGAVVEPHAVGRLGARSCFAVDASTVDAVPTGARLAPLDRLHAELDAPAFTVVSRGVQLVEWSRTHRFCGRCGERTVRGAEPRARACPRCGLVAFPRLAPAVLVAVERDDRILLARSPAFPEPFYSTLAGFVEPAETFEDAVHRETREEVGVLLEDVRYAGSQPWPYPHTMLAGFIATARGTRLTVNRRELLDARWFRADELPPLPPPHSLSRMLIDAWAAQRR